MNHPNYISLAMLQAQKGAMTGNAPFGVVVLDEMGKIVRVDHDRVKEYCDPTAHAEINAIRGLCKKLQQTKLPGYTFYTSSEPCPTCLSACIKAKVKGIYYGAKTEATASLPISAEYLASYAKKHPIEIHGGILAVACLEQRNLLIS